MVNKFLKKSSVSASYGKLLLIGIVCSEKDYRLAYFINKHLHMNFSKQRDIIQTEFRKIQLFIQIFTCSDLDFDYFLLENKQNSLFLLEKYKTINYWLILKPKIPEFNLNELESQIASVPVIMGSFMIDDQKELNKLTELLFQ